jgi:hypothetical protein
MVQIHSPRPLFPLSIQNFALRFVLLVLIGLSVRENPPSCCERGSRRSGRRSESSASWRESYGSAVTFAAIRVQMKDIVDMMDFFLQPSW